MPPALERAQGGCDHVFHSLHHRRRHNSSGSFYLSNRNHVARADDRVKRGADLFFLEISASKITTRLTWSAEPISATKNQRRT